MSAPVYAVKLDLNADGTPETDITTYVTDVYIRRGRSDELQEIQTGVCTLSLNNNDGRFNPEYSSGPYYGTLTTNVKVLVQVTLGATTYPRYTGYITHINVQPKGGMDDAPGVVTIECEDEFKKLKKYHLNQAMATDKLTGDRINDVLRTIMGHAAGDVDLDTGQVTLPFPYQRNTDSLAACQQYAAHDLAGVFFIAVDGKITYRDAHSRALSTSAGTISRAQKIVYDRGDAKVYDSVILRAGSFGAGVAGSDIWTYFPAPVLMTAGQSLRLDPNYNLLANPVTTPVQGTDYIANDATDRSGTDRSSSITSVFTDYGGGAAWKVTLDPARPQAYCWFKVRGTPKGESTDQRAVTSGSGTQTFEATYPLISDLTLLQGFADYIGGHYSTPQPSVQVTLLPHAWDSSDAQFVLMVSLDLNERFTLSDTSKVTSTQLNGDFFIEAIDERISLQNEGHSIVWTGSTFANDQFFILNVNQLNDANVVLGYV